jgi:FAD:protein FMN transferase
MPRVPDPTPPHRSRRPGASRAHHVGLDFVLGTTLDLTVIGPARPARAAQDAVLAEIARLEGVFSRFLPDSDLRRWSRGEAVERTSELFPLLRDAARWFRLSGGAFHPGAQSLADAWTDAEARGTPPADGDLARLVSLLGDVTDGPPPAYPLSLDALAKGRIVDAAVEAAAAVPDVEGVLVNVGGDLRAWGACRAAVAVADPLLVADNAAPIATVHLYGAALATSGVARRGYRVAGRWYPHLIDPRSGRPVEGVAGATVVAPTCAEADALATICCVLDEAAAFALVAGMEAVGLLRCRANGERVAEDRFLSWAPEGVRGLTRGPEHERT